MTAAHLGMEKRLAEAKEGSRELDALLHVATFNEPHGPDDLIWASVPVRDDHCESGTYWRHARSGMSLHTAPNYSTSLDAALALVSRVRPEWRCGFEQAGMFDHSPLCEAWVWPFEDSFEPDWQNGDEGYRSCPNGFRGAGVTPALALCHAIIRSLAKDSENG